MPLGQGLVLEVDSIQLLQSITIARFLAKQCQLTDKNNFLSEDLPEHIQHIEVLYKLYGNGGKFL